MPCATLLWEELQGHLILSISQRSRSGNWLRHSAVTVGVLLNAERDSRGIPGLCSFFPKMGQSNSSFAWGRVSPQCLEIKCLLCLGRALKQQNSCNFSEIILSIQLPPSESEEWDRISIRKVLSHNSSTDKAEEQHQLPSSSISHQPPVHRT